MSVLNLVLSENWNKRSFKILTYDKQNCLHFSKAGLCKNRLNLYANEKGTKCIGYFSDNIIEIESSSPTSSPSSLTNISSDKTQEESCSSSSESESSCSSDSESSCSSDSEASCSSSSDSESSCSSSSSDSESSCSSSSDSETSCSGKSKIVELVLVDKNKNVLSYPGYNTMKYYLATVVDEIVYLLKVHKGQLCFVNHVITNGCIYVQIPENMNLKTNDVQTIDHMYIDESDGRAVKIKTLLPVFEDVKCYFSVPTCKGTDITVIHVLIGKNCIDSCAGRKCNQFDDCGNVCGCPPGKICNPATGTCVDLPPPPIVKECYSWYTVAFCMLVVLLILFILFLWYMIWCTF